MNITQGSVGGMPFWVGVVGGQLAEAALMEASSNDSRQN